MTLCVKYVHAFKYPTYIYEPCRSEDTGTAVCHVADVVVSDDSASQLVRPPRCRCRMTSPLVSSRDAVTSSSDAVTHCRRRRRRHRTGRRAATTSSTDIVRPTPLSSSRCPLPSTRRGTVSTGSRSPDCRRADHPPCSAEGLGPAAHTAVPSTATEDSWPSEDRTAASAPWSPSL